MQKLALETLDMAVRHGVSYADVGVEDVRDRSLATKNGQVAGASISESMGVGIRVLADGCWGFAATDNLSQAGLERATALAVEIARSGTLAKKHDVVLVPEDKHEEVWISACAIDPFATC